MYADSTVHLWGVSILAFCHWLEQEGIIDESVTNRFKLPRSEEKFIPTFTAEEVQKLFMPMTTVKAVHRLFGKR